MIKRLDKKILSKREIEGFLNLMYYGNEKNDDAYGVFSDKGTVTKESGSLDYTKLWDEIKNVKTPFLVGHNRYKTKGDHKEMKNNHPFETENFVVVHNGVISNDETLKKEYNLQYDVQTDSYIISALLEHYLDTLKGDYLTAIKLVAGELYGSYSVMVYYKPEQKLFYFKEYSTRFTFGLLNIGEWNVLVGTTDKDNIQESFSKTVKGIFKIPVECGFFEPKEEKIYEIKEEGIVEVAEFDEKKYVFKRTEHTVKTEPTPATVSAKTVLKLLGNDMANRIKTYHFMEVINRAYNIKDGQIILEVRKEITDEEKIWIQEELVDLGEIEIENIYISNKYSKSKIILDVDRDTINDLLFHSQGFSKEDLGIKEVTTITDNVPESFNKRGIAELFGGS
jgi:glucosamine 6-phosphate synthetase-like amidotransferase/phosphosugar isomerase protein